MHIPGSVTVTGHRSARWRTCMSKCYIWHTLDPLVSLSEGHRKKKFGRQDSVEEMVGLSSGDGGTQ